MSCKQESRILELDLIEKEYRINCLDPLQSPLLDLVRGFVCLPELWTKDEII